MREPGLESDWKSPRPSSKRYGVKTTSFCKKYRDKQSDEDGGSGGYRHSEATYCVFGADGLQLWALSLDSSGRGQTFVVEQLVKGAANSSDVVLRHTKRRGSEPDLLDKVRDLVVVQVHELVHLVLGREPVVRGEAGHAVGRAAQEGPEEGVQVREQEVLVGRVGVGGHVHLERLGAAAVQVIDGHARGPASVGRGEGSVEVREEVDVDAVDLAGSEDARHRDSDVGGGVCGSKHLSALALSLSLSRQSIFTDSCRSRQC